MTLSLEETSRIILSFNNDEFSCPHCGLVYNGGEPDTAMQVVSFWGGEDHQFTCDGCGEDFVVREHVMRSFTTAKTSDDLD